MKKSIHIFFMLVWAGITTLGKPAEHISLEALQQVRLPGVVLQSVTFITSDSKRNASAAHVEVKGVIGGNIRFEMLLPEDWNGRFAMGGNGGFGGTVVNMARDSVNRGYATIGTDTGHDWQPGFLAVWALDNLEAQVNYGYLSVHRAAEVAKCLIYAYYGADPERCYFIGCSRGGGQAMMEAQRYPDDFDGIVAGAPALDMTGFAATMIKIAQTLYPDPTNLDSTVLSREALQQLSDAILAQCDEQDGLKDGIIQDPLSVHFNLSEVPGITDEQRKAIETIYQGAYNEKGPISPGFTKGVEYDSNQLFYWLVGPLPSLVDKYRITNIGYAYGTQIFKYFAFNDPDWDYSTYDFSNYEKDTRLAATLINATDPDLSAFKARDGKLIMWHGWADPVLPAQITVDYYRQVLARDPDAADYCRLFMIPGALHCGGGVSEVDWLSVIVDWVEHDKAPDRLVAAKTEKGTVVMTRPLYAYPKTAVYKGSGDPNCADSFIEAPKPQASQLTPETP